MKLKCVEPLSNFAFNFDLRRYTMAFPVSLYSGTTIRPGIVLDIRNFKWMNFLVAQKVFFLINPSIGELALQVGVVGHSSTFRIDLSCFAYIATHRTPQKVLTLSRKVD